MSRFILFTSSLLLVLGILLYFPFQESGLSRLVRFMPVVMISLGLAGVLISLLSRRVLGTRRADNLLINIAISALAIGSMLLMGEFALRVFFDGQTMSQGGGYFNKIWFDEIDVNSLGFREREIDLTKPENMFRIAVIGDSITFGQGVGEENRFTNRLEKRLNELTGSGQSYEVLNFGLPGAETVDHVRFLQDSVLKTDPDFILLQWYTNDVEGKDKSVRPKTRNIPIELRSRSALFTLLQMSSVRLQRDLSLVGSYEDYMIARFGDPKGPSSLAAEQALQEFIDIANKRDIPVGIMLYIERRSSLDFLAQRVLQICEREVITCLYLGDMFEAYKEDPSRLWASNYDRHPGALAHSLISDQLIDTFEEEWLGN